MPTSNSRSTTKKDPAAVDGSLGYVSATEIRNAWIEFIKKFDKEIWPQGKLPIRSEVLALLESLQYRLLTRAESNYEKHLKPSLSQPKAVESSPEERARYEARQSRLAAWK